MTMCPKNIITASDAKAQNLLASVDSLVWIGNVQWAFCGNVRWTV